MKPGHQLKSSNKTASLLVGLVLALLGSTEALKASPDPATKLSDQPVLDSQKVQLPERSITYNRIAAPVLKPKVLEQAPAASQAAVSADFLPSKPSVSFTVFARVLDGTWSEVTLSQDGIEYVFWSNINFHYFRSFHEFESPDVAYSLFAIAWDDSEANLKKPPQFIASPGAKTAYLFVSPSAGRQSKEVLKVVEELHRHYDLHSQALKTAYEDVQAAQQAAEAELKAHPPKPADSVITFFPIRSLYNKKARE